MAEAGAKFAEALAAFQAELPKLDKANTADTGSYTYRYADLADVSSVVLPLLAKHGLSFSSKPTLDEGKFVLAYVLRHVSGESDSGTYPLPSGTPQQIGSAITYARRYVLGAITGVAPDADDDGKAAGAAPPIQRVHERLWDPVEQDEFVGQWKAEADAVTDLTGLTEALRRMQRNRELSPASKDKLNQVFVSRRVELEQAVPA